MAIASFNDLCAGFCDLVKVTPPLLKADAQGRVAFHVVLRETIVNLVHCPDESPGYAFVVFEFGPLGQDGAVAHDQAQVLLGANFNLLQVHPPVFSINPATGDAVLQYIYPLFEATPHDLYELVDQGVDHIAHWRAGPAAQPVQGGGAYAAASPAWTQEPSASMPNFA